MKLYVVILHNEGRIDLPVEVPDRSSTSYSFANKEGYKYGEENKLIKHRILGVY